MATSRIIEELKRELDVDMLEYGWICSVVRQCGPDDNRIRITEVVYDVIVKLLNDGLVEIGDARAVGGRVEFYAWPGSLEERKSRIKQVIIRLGMTPDLGEGFWLAKPIE